MAGAAGALIAAGWTLVTAPADASAQGAVVPAVVTTSNGCAGGGQDTVSVQLPTGPVTTRLDACGQPQGHTVSVVLAADGSVGDPVPLAGTRSGHAPSALPVVVLAAASVLTVGSVAASVRAGRAGRTRG